MKTLKEKFRKFIHNEDGMEFIQLAVIVLGAIALAGAAIVIYNTVGNKISTAASGMESIDSNLGSWGGT